ncbi:MAG TPA: ABC transporter ATP-binding protein [Verrucomicrobia bacterium]|nr:MAG: ABC transporter ATP-binding protein [Lentisphaerae bacterium GWF2_57_35]HBA82880.1 ABC transporter ATP-binding protein [Verrucomicrobiota bacterium]
MNDTPLLSIKNLNVAYGSVRAVSGISLDVYEGEIVTLMGANGAGKSSTLCAISGLVPYSGAITYQGQSLRKMSPDRLVGMGMAHVPEGRGIFSNLTVHENLRLAAWTQKDAGKIREDFARVFALFPRLRDRQRQAGGTLSGGEQQMLAVGRALMSRARLLLLDEPSMGLAPVLVREIFNILRDINRTGVTILLVEQNANMALRIASRGYVLETGAVVLQGASEELRDSPRMREAYLGG